MASDTTLRPQLGHNLLGGRSTVRVVEHHLGAGVRQRPNDKCANATGSARDERHFLVEIDP